MEPIPYEPPPGRPRLPRSETLACTLLIGMFLGWWAAQLPVKQAPGPAEEHERAHATAPRSGHWPVVRAAYLVKQPVCEACGSSKGLQVHHRRPFHLHPELELDPTNLITLCGPEGHNCHLRIGHGFDYHSYNPHVAEDAALQRERIRDRLYQRRRRRHAL